MHRQLAVILTVLLLAATLRFYGLDFGQPPADLIMTDAPPATLPPDAAVHPDEYLFVQRPLRMLLTGERNPKFFHNPSFLINTNLVVFWLTGEYNAISWDDRAMLSARRQAPFRLFFTGRVFSALGGVLAVAGVYAAGRALAGHVAGTTAAALVAVSLPMVQHAHYATTSSLAAGFVAVCLWATLATIRRFHPILFVLAGVAAGLAAGNRYNAAAISLVVFFAGWVHLYNNRTYRRAGWVLLGWVAFPLTFLFTTPHVIFDTAFVWSEFQFITNRYIGIDIDPLNVSPWLGLRYELRYLVTTGLGPVAAMVALVGIVAGVRTRQQAIMLGLVLTYILPYTYVVLRTIRPLWSDQMLVPFIPAVAVVVGLGAARLQRWMPTPLIALLVLTPPLILSISAQAAFTSPDTRYQAALWAADHLPDGAQVHLYGPYNVPLDSHRYTVTHTYGTGETLEIDALRAQNVDYVIVSDAWFRYFENTPYIDPTYAEQMLAPLQAFVTELPMLYHMPRPFVIGTDDPMHTATYWHHPAITIYCLTDHACDQSNQNR
jgi:hypothetical protein